MKAKVWWVLVAVLSFPLVGCVTRSTAATVTAENDTSANYTNGIPSHDEENSGAGAEAVPPLASAQDDSAQVQSIRADEQIVLGQIMTEKRALFAQAMQLTDDESRAFWPVYDEYEAKVKKIDDRFIRLVDDYAAKYSTMTDVDAQQMLAAKMKIDSQRMELQQAYTKKVAKAVPAIKALRYAQVEWRIDNELQRKVMQLMPLAP